MITIENALKNTIDIVKNNNFKAVYNKDKICIISNNINVEFCLNEQLACICFSYHDSTSNDKILFTENVDNINDQLIIDFYYLMNLLLIDAFIKNII